MAKTHYQVLGLTPGSTATEIRSAYRKLVLQHHPDRSTDPKSKAIFLAATEAYEVLGDTDRRRDYDRRLELDKQVAQKRTEATRKGTPQTPSAKLAEIKLDVNRLSTLYSRGNFVEAEKLAISILDRDRKQPIPYAVLGDIARMSGNNKEAVKMYAYACQYDPKNPVYQRRYDELTNTNIPVVELPREDLKHRPAGPPAKQGQFMAPFFGLGLVVLAGIYIALAKEEAVMPDLKLISTWTLGLIVMLFFSGVAMASSMALDGLLDNFNSLGKNALGRTSPWVALASIAIVSFWAATALYVFIGVTRKAFNYSTSRIIACVVAGTCVLAFAAESTGSISGLQVIVWGGNLVYLGAVCGWMVTDAIRSAG